MHGRPDSEGFPLAAAEALALLDAQREHVRRRVHVDPAVLFSIWGIAWGVGFGAAYLAYGPGRVIPAWLGPAVPAVLLTLGVLASLGYSMSAGRGLHGPSRRAAAMHGWSWLLGFVSLNVVNAALIRRGLAPESAALLWSASALLLVGMLHLAGGALWNDRAQYGLGLWTLVCAAGSVVAGVPGNFLVMAVVGGGGFLGLAGLSRRTGRLRRRPRP